jgi:hypothetical protein
VTLSQFGIYLPTGEQRWAGESRGWSYSARRISGTGVPGPWLDRELPLQDVQITDVLSGPPLIKATIDPVYQWAFDEQGDPLLQEWTTEIYAEADGVIRGAYILDDSQMTDSGWQLEGAGFTRYIKDRPYNGRKAFVETDPLTIVRHVWDTVQAEDFSNVNLQLDRTTTTPMRIGKALPVASADANTPAGASQDEEPFELNPEEITDLGGMIDELAEATPFDYRERSQWNADQTEVERFLDFGYPTLGARRTDVRLVYGENVFSAPTIERNGADFANYVRVFGAGEGSEAIVADAVTIDGRLRRYATVDDDTISDPNRARIRARRELIRRNHLVHVRSVKVTNTGNLQLGSVRPGDEVRLQAETPWMDIDMWNRVVSIGTNPDDPEILTFGLLRSDA